MTNCADVTASACRSTKDCDASFAADVNDAQKIWKVLKAHGYVTGLAAPLANHIMGTR